MIILKTYSAIASALLVLWFTAPAQAQSSRAWVSGKGADAAGCGAPTNACRSFQYVHDNVIAAGGEIDVLDPAGYGAITITKALSIVNDGVGTAGVQQSTAGANAITINAGSSDAVTLRGLNIDGLGVGANGIVFNSGASLAVVNCVIRHFAYDGAAQNIGDGTGNGVLIAPTSGSMNFVVSNTIASDNGFSGLSYLPPSGAANSRVVIDHLAAFNNLNGVAVDTAGASGALAATIVNSVASNNSYAGLLLSPIGGAVAATVDSSYMDNNQYGIVVAGAAVAYLNRSVIASNSVDGALNNTTANTLYSYLDNRINGNATNVGGTPLNTSVKPFSLAYKGFDYVAYYNGAYENANSLAALAATGANAIEASIEYGIDPQNSTIYTDANYTDSLTALGATIKQAAGLGLTVMVRPLVDFVDQTDLNGTPYSLGEWRAYYNPGAPGSVSANAFFASYQAMILQQAQVAAANGATSLSIGTELDQFTGPAYKSYWDSIISALRADYPSLKLTYSSIWDDNLSPWQWGGAGLAVGTGNLATQVSFAGELDFFGVDCYAPISDAANPTLAQLIAGWTQPPTDSTSLAVTGGQSLIAYFASVATAVGKPLLFTELGYENATDAASQPAESSTNVVDSNLQAALYQAFFEAWQQAGNSAFAGVYFWNWDPNAAEVGPGQGVNFSPQGLPAQGVVSQWFGGSQP
ncbi:hypothetical protein [Methylocapsa sp. S129]|uniref:glycoside hydrolase family 113 n=1 Tax=Methylocapsa sp. S129 TaxID=1641869 RepID=UPI00131E9008|nr:hypothetical protein [Methylocapsa sp. S129]